MKPSWRGQSALRSASCLVYATQGQGVQQSSSSTSTTCFSLTTVLTWPQQAVISPHRPGARAKNTPLHFSQRNNTEQNWRHLLDRGHAALPRGAFTCCHPALPSQPVLELQQESQEQPLMQDLPLSSPCTWQALMEISSQLRPVVL